MGSRGYPKQGAEVDGAVPQGSKQHHVKLRGIARTRGLSISEYGLARLDPSARLSRASDTASFLRSSAFSMSFSFRCFGAGPRLFGVRPDSSPASRARRHAARCDE